MRKPTQLDDNIVRPRDMEHLLLLLEWLDELPRCEVFLWTTFEECSGGWVSVSTAWERYKAWSGRQVLSEKAFIERAEAMEIYYCPARHAFADLSWRAIRPLGTHLFSEACLRKNEREKLHKLQGLYKSAVQRSQFDTASRYFEELQLYRKELKEKARERHSRA